MNGLPLPIRSFAKHIMNENIQKKTNVKIFLKSLTFALHNVSK